MDEQINEFLNKKNISNPVIRQLTKLFIVNHTKLYGNAISFETLMERLDKNLSTVRFVSGEERINKNLSSSVFGYYEGFNINEIAIFMPEEKFMEYYTPSSTDNAVVTDEDQKFWRVSMADIYIHELSHCAYTIKRGQNIQEHMFEVLQEQPTGEVKRIDGSPEIKEAMVNYISTSILGRKNNLYPAGTASFERLAQKVDITKLIKSAWDSSSYDFEQVFSRLSPQNPKAACDTFRNGLYYFESGRYKDGIKLIDESLGEKRGERRQDIFSETTGLKNQHSNLSTVKLSNLEHQLLLNNNMKRVRQQGKLNVLLLVLLVIILIIFTIGLSILALK